MLAENLRSARCSPFAISGVLAAHMRKLITAPARNNKGTARMLANVRKDHSIPLPFCGRVVRQQRMYSFRCVVFVH